MPQFDYVTTSVNALRPVSTDDKGHVTLADFEGRSVRPTDRYWTSLCANFSTYGLTKKLFSMFTHDEVFNRLAERVGDTPLRYTIAKVDHGNGHSHDELLAVTRPDKPLAKYDDVIGLLDKYDGKDVKYQDGKLSGSQGIIQSWHTPPRMEEFNIGGDTLFPQFVLETPIDGFGKPLIYLSLLRQVCTNGMIGYARAFRSELSLGKGDDVMFSLERALESYSNEEGYMALRNRLEAATNSYASISECGRVVRELTKTPFAKVGEGSPYIEELGDLPMRNIMGSDGASEISHQGMRIQKAFGSITGDLCHIYGIANIDALSRKKMAQLPAKCTVYDLMNFATEVATHYADGSHGKKLQSVVGQLLGEGEYDLENSMNEIGSDFSAWQVATEEEAADFVSDREEIHEDLLN